MFERRARSRNNVRLRVEELEPRLVLTLPAPAHVVIVVEENHSFSDIIGSSSAPYLNSLAHQGALMTHMSAIEHPSQPNYLDLFSGSNQNVTDDLGPHTFSTPNLGSELLAAHRTFDGYSESMPFVGYTGITYNNYYRKHNPWSDFSNVPKTDNRPFSLFPSDFNSLPTVSFVVPNQKHDMHDPIVGGLGTIGTADDWLRANLDPYVEWARDHNSLLIVTFDEDDHSESNRIPTIFVGPMVQPGAYSESVNHFSLLRTVEDMYHLPHAGKSASARPIADIWANPSLPTVSIAATDASASVAGQDTGTFTVSRSGGTSAALTVNYSIGGTARNGLDYTTLAGSVTIPVGSSSQTITVNPVDEQVAVGTQTVALSLRPSGSHSYNVGADHGATVTITDEESSVVPLIQAGSRWKYLDNGSNQGTSWRGRSFNDSTWKSGLAPLGYGGADRTVVGYGPRVNNKYITTYFRQSFEVANKAAFSALQLGLIRDDGAVVYLNGVEVFRSNMPAGTLSSATPASVALFGSEESSFVQVSLDPALLINGKNVLAVEIHQANRTSSDLRFDLKLTGQTTNPTLIQGGSVWKYLDDGSNQGTSWRARSFNDSTWASGSAQLGYGDSDERTVVNYGPDPASKYITTYFRTTFYADHVASFSGLLLRLVRDDGAVVYLNGVEVFRSNMPAGTVSSTTPASVAIGGAQESSVVQASLNPALLVNGKNVLAVEIHQANRTSSDIRFDLSLVGEP